MAAADLKTIEVAVLAVLMGNPATEIAEQMSLPVDDLLTAADLYRAAGYTALENRDSRDGWQLTADTGPPAAWSTTAR